MDVFSNAKVSAQDMNYAYVKLMYIFKIECHVYVGVYIRCILYSCLYVM